MRPSTMITRQYIDCFIFFLRKVAHNIPTPHRTGTRMKKQTVPNSRQLPCIVSEMVTGTLVAGGTTTTGARGPGQHRSVLTPSPLNTSEGLQGRGTVVGFLGIVVYRDHPVAEETTAVEICRRMGLWPSDGHCMVEVCVCGPDSQICDGGDGTVEMCSWMGTVGP